MRKGIDKIMYIFPDLQYQNIRIKSSTIITKHFKIRNRLPLKSNDDSIIVNVQCSYLK